ncbi:dynamin family protein [Lentibacillus sp. Marseille-P4043]|uniref:dynamin family protein n=1 Tax=Lentibacillus sp. Marseille-P4043 TaxID=2040293 RepID=UPI000D0ACCC3|nr:dynamin family protein [Lentibacillus sp. Marseille-P4043]
MESITTLPSRQIKTNQLAALYETMLENGDEKSAIKLLELYEKMKKKEFVVSFAGHFSAGKSTMINTLLEEDILPESPIPTSANVVKISSGDGVARVYFHHDAPIEHKEPYDIEMIKDYCKDKDTIKKIELSTSRKIVPANTVIFDTPGIDAADDADRLITEASMHLVDMLVYVMDYNHVQSEVNLQFLHTLNEKGIPFFVVINQIDKHDEAELSFQAFETSVSQTFDQWNIIPEAIYYSSLINDQAAHNQFQTLKSDLFALMTTNKDTNRSQINSLQQIANEHKHYLTNEHNQKISSLSEVETDKAEVLAQKNEIEQKIASIEDTHRQLEQKFRHELQTTLQNAYLMPYEIREKAENFLQSQQDDFKIGLFGSKKKTNEERENRLQTFLNALCENMEAVVQWKLRDKLADLLKQFGITDRELVESVQDLSIDYTGDELLVLVKSGAKVTGESVLNYTNDVSNDIKQKYKTKALQLWDTIDRKVTQENKANLLSYEKEREELHAILKQLNTAENMEQTLSDKQSTVDEILLHPDQSPAISLDEELLGKYSSMEQRDVERPITSDDKPSITDDPTEPLEQNEKTKSLQDVESSIEQTIQTLSSVSGFQTIVDELKTKQQQLANRTYTIALFGAFSAGKSSFANALLGERVLPVSPNPTTAAINRICPTTEKHGHGTVIVQMKKATDLYDDLRTITKHFSPTAGDLAGLLQWIKENDIHESEDLQQMYQSYLRAMVTGYPENKDLIGEQVTVTIDDFSRYVSDETKACFVESIDLYYDCSITKQGITLVDTPGADSVNSRHTNVAFDYIKYADAILYVTYYNHALSRADKDFLMQLGRVKDAFQLDKMFFIVNAADLAKDENELNLVTDYVEEQLIQLGIRFPKLFPVSSKQALKAKQNHESQTERMIDFEQKFYHFIHNDLAAMSIQSALLDIKRAYQAVTNYIESASLNEQEKVQYREDLFSKREMLEQAVNEMNAGIYPQQIEQKIEKQLYYVIERLGIRFHDMFKEFFNPTTITETGKKAMIQLRKNTDGLLDYIGYELVQELRAVSLRVESYVQSLAQDAYAELNEKSTQIDKKLMLPGLASFDLTTPEYQQAFTELDQHIFQKSLALFKSTKAFFEKNEKEQMKEEMYQTLAPFAQQYIDENKGIMVESYRKQWDHVIKTVQQKTCKNIDMYVDNSLSMLTETVDMELLAAKQEKLAAIIDSHHI